MTTETAFPSFSAGLHRQVFIVAKVMSLSPPGRPWRICRLSRWPLDVRMASATMGPVTAKGRDSWEYGRFGMYVHDGIDTPSTPERYTVSPPAIDVGAGRGGKSSEGTKSSFDSGAGRLSGVLYSAQSLSETSTDGL